MTAIERFGRWFAGLRPPRRAPQTTDCVGYRRIPVPTREGRSVEVAAWYPALALPGRHVYATGRVAEGVAVNAAARPGPWPLVVFSHGYSGASIGSASLMERIAAAGYVVAAPEHADAVKGNDIDGALKDLGAVPPSIEAHGYRIEDVRAVAECLSGAGALFTRTGPVALIGHSMGGWTVAQAALQSVSACALASWSAGELHWAMRGQRLISEADLGRLTMPTCWLVGEREAAALSPMRAPVADLNYRDAGGWAWLEGIPDGDHFIYLDPTRSGLGGTPEQLERIVRVTTAFLDAAVKGKAASYVPDRRRDG